MVTVTSEEEHIHNVHLVLQCLQKYGIRAQAEKCTFLGDSAEYLGHKVDAKSLHTADKKVKAITRIPKPKNVQELRSFLGLLHGKFLLNLATLLQPLNDLLKTGRAWAWKEVCSRAFQKAKALLISAPILAHYDPSLPLKLAGDASAYGIGAVIPHVYPDSSERPVAYASRTLSLAECNYAQTEKEALSLVFGVRKFHQYLYGRTFTLVTDHKPLATLLGPKKGIPPLAAAMLQRWALQLAAYSYTIQFRPTQRHANADSLSHLPLPITSQREIDTFIIGQHQALPEPLQTATCQDPQLSAVHQYVRQGWPEVTPPDSHSKWPEVVAMPSTTVHMTIAELQKLFAAYGIPEQVVSDNRLGQRTTVCLR